MSEEPRDTLETSPVSPSEVDAPARDPADGDSVQTMVQDIAVGLVEFWRERDCLALPPVDLPLADGCLAPACFLRLASDQAWRAVGSAVVRRSSQIAEIGRARSDERSARGRRRRRGFARHRELQVIAVLKSRGPDLARDAVELLRECLLGVGVSVTEADVRLSETEWVLEAYGLWGVGWHVHLDGVTVGSVAFLREAGGIELDGPVLRYELLPARIGLLMQGRERVADVQWSPGLPIESVVPSRSASSADGAVAERLESVRRELGDGRALRAWETLLLACHEIAELDAAGTLDDTDRRRWRLRTRELSGRCLELSDLTAEDLEVPRSQEAGSAGEESGGGLASGATRDLAAEREDRPAVPTTMLGEESEDAPGKEDST